MEKWKKGRTEERPKSQWEVESLNPSFSGIWRQGYKQPVVSSIHLFIAQHRSSRLACCCIPLAMVETRERPHLPNSADLLPLTFLAGIAVSIKICFFFLFLFLFSCEVSCSAFFPSFHISFFTLYLLCCICWKGKRRSGVHLLSHNFMNKGYLVIFLSFFCTCYNYLLPPYISALWTLLWLMALLFYLYCIKVFGADAFIESDSFSRK